MNVPGENMLCVCWSRFRGAGAHDVVEEGRCKSFGGLCSVFLGAKKRLILREQGLNQISGDA